MEEEITEILTSLHTWIIGIIGAAGGTTILSIVTAVFTFVKYCGKAATARQTQLALQTRAMENKKLKEKSDLLSKRITELEEQRIYETNANKEAFGHATTALSYFINGSRASDECKASANKELTAAYSALPQYSEKDVNEIFSEAEMYSAQANSKRVQAMAAMTEKIGEMKSVFNKEGEKEI